jgi:4-hydroxy-tetrahydrodipicolinate synthase
MVTPFSATAEAVDHDAFTLLAQHLLRQGSDGLLVFGTTGESPTLSLTEKIGLLQTAHKVLAQQATTPTSLWAGLSGNDTAQVVRELKQLATEAPLPTCYLATVPYYNKPSAEGLLAHFSALAEASPRPLVLYNIPGRTGVLLQPHTMAQLHQRYPTRIVGVKQSYGDMEVAAQVRRQLPLETFHLWAGDDSLVLPMLSLGAVGLVSVLSHLAGPTLRRLIEAYHQGNTALALQLYLRLLNPAQGLFTKTNPTLVKAALAQQGHLPHNTLRLPMVPLAPEEVPALLEPLLADIAALQEG